MSPPVFCSVLFTHTFGDIHSGQCFPILPLLCVSCSATDGHRGGRWSWEQVGGGTIGAGRIRKRGTVGEEKEVKRSQQGQRTTHTHTHTPVPWRQGGVSGAETHLSPWGSRHWRGGGKDELEGDTHLSPHQHGEIGTGGCTGGECVGCTVLLTQ